MAQPSRPSADREHADPLDHTEHLGTCFALIEASLLLQQRVEGMLRAEGGISLIQLRLLVALADAEGALRMSDLAEQLVLSRSGLTYQADSLEARGLLIRSPATDDERSVETTVTDAGRALVDRLLPQYLDTVRHVVLANLDDRQVQQFVQALSEARDSMRPGSSRTGPPVDTPSTQEGDATREPGEARR